MSKLPAALVKITANRRAAAFLIAAVSTIVYLNALGNGFVYDDEAQVVNNQWLRDPSAIADIFTSGVWGFRAWGTNYYRPLMHIAYLGIYQSFGLSPAAFHALNILLNACVSVLVYLVIYGLIFAPGEKHDDSTAAAAFFAALIFAVHPVHTEAVTWIAGLPDMMYTLFFLLSFYLYTRGPEGRNAPYGPYYILSVLSFLVAALCKEPALLLPAVLAGYDHVSGRRPVSVYGYLKRYGPYVAVALAYLAVRAYSLGGLAPRARHPELTGYELVLNAFTLFSGYMVKLVFPVGLNAFHVLHPVHSITEPVAALSVVASVLFVAACIAAYRRSAAAFMGLLLLGLPLLPVLYIPVLGENSFAERYLYLPSAGGALLFALLLGRVFSSGRAAVAALSAVIVILAAFSAATVLRNRVWKDDLALWSDVVVKSPDSAIANNNYGRILMRSDATLPEAITYLNKALAIDPSHESARVNLGVTYFRMGYTDKAIEELDIALSLGPAFADTYYNLGVAYSSKGMYEKAASYLEQAIRLNPNDQDYRNSLDKAYAAMGRK